MSVRARYLIVIIGLLVSLVLLLGYFQCSRLMSAHISSVTSTGNVVAANVFDLAQQAINNNQQLSAKDVIRDSQNVKAWLEAGGRSHYFAYLAILATDNTVIAEFDPQQMRSSVNSVPIESLKSRRWISQLLELRRANRIYEVSTPLNVNQLPFGRVVVGIPPDNVYQEIVPVLRLTLIVALAAIFVAILLAVFLSNLVVSPLQEFVGIIEQLEDESSLLEDEREPAGQDLQSAAQRLRELGRRFAGNRSEIETMRDQMRQVVNSLPDRLLLIDREQRIMMASPELENLLLDQHRNTAGNGTRHSLRGAMLSEVLDQSHPLMAMTRDAFSTGKSTDGTLTLSTPNHGQQTVLASVQMFEDKGRLTGALVTLRDFESLKRLENQLDYAARLAALSRITSGVAHEVKNPLHAMVLHLELLRAKLEGGRDPGTHVDVLTSEVNRLNRVVQTFLDFTRPVQLQNRKCDLNELVREVTLLAPVTPGGPIQIIVNYAPEPLVVECDLDLLKQALLNIVINACQAMPSGGIIMITTSRTSSRAEIVVTDQGKGIPDEIREKIFNLYFTTKESGSGIGLAQAFRAVQMHSGEIEVHSEIDKGTSFKISLPLA